MKVFLIIILLALKSFYGFSQNDKKIDSLLSEYKTKPNDTSKVSTIAHLFNSLLYQDIIAAKKYAYEELSLSKKLDHEKGIALAYYHLGVYNNNIDEIDSAKFFYSKSLKIYQRLNDDKSKANVNHGLAILEYSIGNLKSALNILDENIILYSKKPMDSSNLATTYTLKGGIYRQLGKYKTALNECVNALRIYEKLNEEIRKADALGVLASLEFSLENYNKSINYNTEALEIYKKYNDKQYTAQALNDIGNTYFYLNKYDEALIALNESLKISEKINSKDIKATVLGNIGKIYTKQNKFEKAIKFLNESISITKKTGNKYKTSESLNDLGILFNAMNKPYKALPLFDESISISKKIDAKLNLRISYFNKSEAFSKLNKNKIALNEYKKFTELSDSIFNKSKSNQIEELRTIYETEKKEQQISLQNKEIEILKQKEKNSNLQRLLLGIGLLLTLIVIYSIYQTLKRNKLEKEKITNELAFKKKELTTHALHLAKKNELLDDLKQKAKAFKDSDDTKNGYQQLIKSINFDLKDDNNWENFSKYFQEVHKDFNFNVKQKFPDVTTNELRLMSLLKMNLSSKEIANILNISPDGVKKARYRLRKKINITSEESLEDLVLSL